MVSQVWAEAPGEADPGHYDLLVPWGSCEPVGQPRDRLRIRDKKK